MSGIPTNETMDRVFSQLKAILNAVNMFAEGEEVSMRPSAVWKRCVKVANYATVLVMLIVYPILFAYRGLDYHLMAGMLLHYLLLWCLIVFLFLFLHVSWIIGYFFTQRFCSNMLDFEILDQILGRDNYGADMSDFEDLDMLDNNDDAPNPDVNQNRAAG